MMWEMTMRIATTVTTNHLTLIRREVTQPLRIGKEMNLCHG